MRHGRAAGRGELCGGGWGAGCYRWGRERVKDKLEERPNGREQAARLGRSRSYKDELACPLATAMYSNGMEWAVDFVDRNLS